MTMDWLPLMHPLILFGVLLITGTCVLYTFVLHLRIQTMARRGREEREHLERHVSEIREAAERWRAEREEAAAPVPVPAGQPLNLNKRGQVLRMRRRGENPETIAAALSIPQNEVALLLKVHQMSLDQAEKGTVQAG